MMSELPQFVEMSALPLSYSNHRVQQGLLALGRHQGSLLHVYRMTSTFPDYDGRGPARITRSEQEGLTRNATAICNCAKYCALSRQDMMGTPAAEVNLAGNYEAQGTNTMHIFDKAEHIFAVLLHRPVDPDESPLQIQPWQRSQDMHVHKLFVCQGNCKQLT